MNRSKNHRKKAKSPVVRHAVIAMTIPVWDGDIDGAAAFGLNGGRVLLTTGLVPVAV